MSLLKLFKKLADENGIELDQDELDQLGLSDDEVEDIADGQAPASSVSLDDVLSGEAAGAIEVFLSSPGAKPIESDGLMWEPIIRSGVWAVRPGAGGQKRRVPLKVVAGRSTNARKEIGLLDIKEAFDDDAIQHVTVPTSHDNRVTENTGFIKALKIVKGKVKNLKTKKDVAVDVLMGGYDIRRPEVKEQMQLGTIANRSAGLLYDYVNTETGKKYKVVLEHVALTNKPWITGMKSFGRKLAKITASQTVGLSLSEEEPADFEMLSTDDALEGIELATAELSAWTQDEDPDWLREQTSNVLRAARAKKAAMKGEGSGYLVYESVPNYRCVRAKPGLALISDGWGDDANYWTAPIKVVDGYVELEEDLAKWQAAKREYVTDEDRKEFPAGREPLDEPQADETETVELSRIERARRNRRSRAQELGQQQTSGNEPGEEDNTTHPRGGEHMAGENSGTLQFSEEAQARIRAAEARAKAAEEKTAELSEKVSKLLGAHQVSSADTNIAMLKSMGFSEDRGFAGVLAEARALFAADDGEPAVQSDSFADDSNSTGELSLSEAVMRIFNAFEKTDKGLIKLGQDVVKPPSETNPTDETKVDETNLGDGKPPKGEEETSFDSLSEEEQLIELAKDNPELIDQLRLSTVVAGMNSNGNGEAK